MTTRIELEAMKFYAYHGVMPQEAKVGNHFVVNLVLTASLEQAVKSDELEDTINYATVYTIVKEQMDIPSKLIEHVAGRILYALKDRFPGLAAIEFLAKRFFDIILWKRVEKPSVIFSGGEVSMNFLFPFHKV